MRTLKNWFKNRFAAEPPAPPRVTGSYRQRIVEAGDSANKPKSDEIDLEPRLRGSIESIGPGKNVFVRSQYAEDESGTDNSLEIVDELSLDSENADGVDPYNTGRFDISKNWNSRSRK